MNMLNLFKQLSSVSLACAAVTVFSNSAALAQSYDLSTLSTGGGNANESMAATGVYGRGSFKTGQSPAEARLYGHTTGVTKKGLGSVTTGLGHLQLPYANTAGLAPVFGFGQQVIMPPRYTSVLDDAITTINPRTGTLFSVTPSTGEVYSRIGNMRTGLTYDGSGNPSVAVDNGNGVGASVGSGGISVGSGVLGGVLGGSGGGGSGF